MIAPPELARPLRVGAWPLRLITNSYNSELYRHLSEFAEVVPVEADRSSLRTAWAGGIDILHVHWIDRVLWNGDRIGSLRRMALMLAIAATVRFRGGRVVWTAHDPAPHEMRGTGLLANRLVRAAWRGYEAAMVRQIDGVLVLTASHAPTLRANLPALAEKPFAVTPHPHYRGVYPDGTSHAAARAALDIAPDARVLVHLGSIRPYKGVLGLLTAFAAMPDPNTRLVLAGALDGDDAFNRSVQEAAAADPRVLTDFGYIPDDRLQVYLRAADAAALPFTEVTNSGSAILALSYDLPIIVPDEPIFRDLAEQVGKEWVALVTLPLDGNSLSVALDKLSSVDGQPDLSKMNWPDVAAATVSFFSDVMRR